MRDRHRRAPQPRAHPLSATRYGALDNHCPHQGGPLGEGSIEKGWLRCPWHGYDYDPLTGTPPPGFTDAPACFPVEVRDDGIYVELDAERAARAHGLRRDGRDDGRVGRHPRVRHGRPLQPRVRRRDAPPGGGRATSRSSASATRARPRSRRRRTASSPAGRPRASPSPGPGSTNLLTGLYDAKVDRAPVLAHLGSGAVEGARPGRVPGPRPRPRRSPTSPASRRRCCPTSDHAELMTLALKHALVERDVAHLVLPDEVQELPAPDGRAVVGPVGRVRRRRDRAAGRRGRATRSRSSAGAQPAGDRRRPRRALRHGRRASSSPRRSTRRCSPRSRPRAWSPTITRSARGVLGRSGTPVASWLMNESDLLVVFGASFSNHTGIAPYKPIVQVDFDPMALGRFHPVTVPVLGHVGVTARLLLDAARAGAARPRSTSGPTSRSGGRSGGRRRRRRLRRRPRARRGSAAVFDALTRHVPERRGHRGRRRQPRLLVRPLLRVHRASRS